MQCIDSFSFLLQRYARKGINAKNLAIFRIFLCNQKNPVKCSTCMVSKKIVIKHGIAFLEIRLFLENHLLEFHKICHKNTSGSGNWTLTELLDITVFKRKE